MTAVLGNAVPAPDNNDALERLISAIEKLAGNKGSGSSSGGGGRRRSNDPLLKEEQAEERRIKALASLFRQRSRALYQLELQRESAERRLQAQRSRALLAEQKSLESAEQMAKKIQQQAAASLARQRSAALNKEEAGNERLEGQWINRGTLKAWRKRNAAALREESDSSDHFTEQNARERLKKHRQKTADDLQKLETKWLNREKRDREAYKDKQKKEQKKLDDLNDLIAFNRTNNLLHSKGTIRQARKLLGFRAYNDLFKENESLKSARNLQTAGERLAASLDAIDKLIAFKANRGMKFTETDLFRAKKYGSANVSFVERELQIQADTKKKAAQDRIDKRKKDTLADFQADLIAKSQAGMSLTKGDLKRAIRLNSPDIDSIRASLQSDADAKAAKKAEAEAAREAKKKGFFGGFARNIMIGGLYQAIGPVMAPLTKFTSGVMEPALNALKAFGDQAHQQGRGLAFNTGMAEALGSTTYGSRASAAAMLQSNAMQEMNTAVSSKMVAGINESAGRLADSASSMFTNALVSPLTGFKAIVDQIGNAVGMFNPGIMSRFNIMFRDLTATIGSGLAPVMNLITDLMRAFGDYLQPVISEALPKFRELMGDLYRTLAPMIPTLVQAIKEMIEQFSGGLKKFAASGDKGAFVKNALLEATGLPNVNQMVNQAKGAVAGAMIGAAIGSAVPVIGTMVGGLAGGLIGSIAGRNWEGEGGFAAARAQNAANLQRGNITGMAAATDARFSSGMDIAKQAAQTAFLASSSIGMTQGADLDMELKQQQLKWFKKANNEQQLPDAVNGNAQAGIAGGGGNPFGGVNGGNNPNPFGGVGGGNNPNPFGGAP